MCERIIFPLKGGKELQIKSIQSRIFHLLIFFPILIKIFSKFIGINNTQNFLAMCFIQCLFSGI